MRTSFSYNFYRSIWTAVDWVFPPECAGCGKPGFRFCDDCWSKTEKLDHQICPKCGSPLGPGSKCKTCENIKPAFEKLRSYTMFRDPIRKAIHNLKYKQDLSLAMTLAEPLVDWIRNELKWDFEIIVPVPLNKERQKLRGFNQTSLIAFPISLALGIPFAPKAIHRVKNTISQVGLSAAARIDNMHNAFLADDSLFKGSRVLLIDDVVTTGATINACSNALIQAGAKTVYCASVAKTPFKTNLNENINEMVT